MMLKKSKQALILGTVSLVKANMSRRSPGTAADIIFFGPRADLISERRIG